MQIWETWGSPNLHILKKDQQFDAKSAQNLHILKKIKNFDSEKSPNLHMLKKIKNIKKFRLYVGLTGIDELVFDFFDYFEYMRVWWLFTIKMFDFFEGMQVWCLFTIKILDFFEYMQVWWASSLKPTFLQPSNDMVCCNLFSSFNIYLSKLIGIKFKLE